MTLPSKPALKAIFEQINSTHFDEFLDPPHLEWNSKLRTSAGRFKGGSRAHPNTHPPTIEIATYLLHEKNSDDLIHSTMSHEMIHYWLWVRKRPHGHTEEFLNKMKKMGAKRYNPVPRRSSRRYTYICDTCQKQFHFSRLRNSLACQACCNKFNDGKYDLRFKLNLIKKGKPT